MQILVYHAWDCDKPEETPYQYWCLVINNIVYFVFFFITIAVQMKIWCSTPSEKEVKEAVKDDEKEDEKARTNKMQ